MGDQDRRAPPGQRVQRVVDPLLGLRVDRRGRVVQDDHRWFRDQRPSQGDALALAARQGQAALADDRVVAVGQEADEPVGLRRGGDRDDLLVARAWTAVGDVGADRVREQEHLFEHDGDLAAQRGELDVAHVDAVDRHPAGRSVVEPRQQHRRRRLAGTARADQRDRLAGADRQVEVVEDVVTAIAIGAAVAEAHVVETDLAALRPEADGVWRVDDVRRRVEDVEQPLAAGAGLLSDCQRRRHHPHRRDHLQQVRAEREERAEREVSVDRQPAAGGEDADLSDDRDRRQGRGEQRLDPGQAGPRPVQVAARFCEVLELAALLAETLDDAHAGDRLVDDAGDLAGALLRIPRRREHGAAHLQAGDQQRRHDQQGDQRQWRREHGHHHERDDQQHDVAEQDRHDRQDRQQHPDVAGGPGDDLSRVHAVVGGEVEALQPVVHRDAQVVADVEGNPSAERTAGERHREREDAGDDQQRHQRGDLAVVADERVVDDHLLDDGGEGDHDLADHRRADGEDDPRLVDGQERAQAPQPAARGRGGSDDRAVAGDGGRSSHCLASHAASTARWSTARPSVAADRSSAETKPR
jgi:hypothetical protein